MTFLYHRDSPEEDAVRALAVELTHMQVDVKLVESDSREGIALRELHDLTGNPAMILTRDDGIAVQRWENQLPLATDVSYLAHS